MKYATTLLIVLLALPLTGAAEEPQPRRKSDGPTILDFEADVIEGKRKTPELFLQTEADSVSPDVLVFIRKDFNEFHANEKLRRPVRMP